MQGGGGSKEKDPRKEKGSSREPFSSYLLLTTYYLLMYHTCYILASSGSYARCGLLFFLTNFRSTVGVGTFGSSSTSGYV
jgi:hypothetical protein